MEVAGEGARPTARRVAVMPTTHGPRAAVRLAGRLDQPRSLEDLGLPAQVLAGIKRYAVSDAGMLIVTGPAGSGKTTTLYALLSYIAGISPGLSMVALEDPVERDVAGVTQIEVKPFGELTYERALRSILRQDPQVLMLGEVRDAATASLAVQAALSGHRLACTLHAGTPAEAIARLLEMGVEPYSSPARCSAWWPSAWCGGRTRRAAAIAGVYPWRKSRSSTDRFAVLSLAAAMPALCSRRSPPREAAQGFSKSAADLVAAGITDMPEVERSARRPRPCRTCWPL